MTRAPDDRRPPAPTTLAPTALNPATLAAQAAGAKDTATAGVVPAIHMSSTYLRDADYQLERPDNMYARDHNDTVRAAEALLQRLEHAAATRLFPSGMAAIAAVFRTLPQGARVVMQSGIYWGTTSWVRGFCARRGITLEEVDATATDTATATLAQALARPAALVWLEVPSNPWLKTVDIARAATLAQGAGAMLAVDATAASPVLMRPLSLGANVVMHSATKAINGHSDVVAGVLSVADEALPLWQAVLSDRHDAGAILGPMEAWLLLRGARTLPLRMERMCRNAQAVADYLDAHPGIAGVFYPGLPTHDGHDVAARQMSGGFGYLLSALVAGGRDRALQVTGRLRLFHRATSLGGVESLVEHRHTIEPDTGIPDTLLRLSVGIEDADDLIADLAQALEG